MFVLTTVQLGETLNYMQDLIYYSKEHPELSVPEALESLVSSYNQPQTSQNPIRPAFPDGGVRAYGAAGISPHIANQLLPGSAQTNGSPHMNAMNLNGMNAHTPSPHQSNMAPPMVTSLSHQGSSTSGPSANTSPNVTSKRRRSTVKAEGDDGPAPKVKASPRMNNNAKRMKNG
jgi:hypothetical protein